MPKFFGLTIIPENPTFTHSAQSPCTCLAPGSVHERYIAMDELLSPRGLQGSPDWEGKGALALVPVESAAVVLPRSPSVIAAASVPLAGSTAQAAAMSEAHEHGLTARPDWQRVPDGARVGWKTRVKIS
jgi:hypothetical protein